jgi:hypothetical protein
MKKIIAKINFSANNKFYIAGEEITGLTFNQIVKLNEQGFIEPLKYEDLIVIERELKKKEEL